MNENTITIAGNVVSEVRHAVTAAGYSVTRFRMVSQPRRFDRNAERWVDQDPSFFTVVCWRNLADNVAACVQKGDPVIVNGKLVVREWERDERHGTAVEIDAGVVGHDLGRGAATFTRRQAKASRQIGESSAA